jgi:hypothetical protein
MVLHPIGLAPSRVATATVFRRGPPELLHGFRQSQHRCRRYLRRRSEVRYFVWCGRGKSQNFAHDEFGTIAGNEILFTGLPQPFGGLPQREGKEPNHQSEESRDGLAIFFKEPARADFKRDDGLGSTFCRLEIGALVMGLLHALLKRIGKPDRQSGNGYKKTATTRDRQCFFR